MLKASLLIGLAVAMGAGLARSAQPQGENLLMPLPDGFKVGASTRSAQVQVVEYIPATETVSQWSRMVTQQTNLGRQDADPDALPILMARGWAQACPTGAAKRLNLGVEHGYRVSIWMFLCPQMSTTGASENTWVKVISGAENLYAIQYASRGASVSDAAPGAMRYLSQVAVCDSRRAASPCPDIK